MMTANTTAQQSPEMLSLRHRIAVLELLCEEYRAKAKRMAAEADYCARMYKAAREEKGGAA